MRASLLPALSGLVLAGCSTVAGGPRSVAEQLPSIAAGQARPSGDGRLQSLARAIDDDCYAIPAAAKAPAPAAGAKVRRDQLAKLYMLRADDAYFQYERALLNDDRQVNFLATIASLGLATAGSVAGGHTARVLSAANAGVIGERAAFTREYLFDKTIASLENQMRANRSAVATRVYQGMARGVDEYTTCDALRDLLAYEQAGTLAEGLTGIADTTAVRASEEKVEENKAKQLVYATAPLAIALRDYFAPADDIVMATRVARGVKSLAMVNLSPPTGMSAAQYFAEILSGDAFAVQQRALALAVLMTETDIAARTPIAAALQ